MANENVKKEDLKETLDDRELNAEELEQGTGGRRKPRYHYATEPCSCSSDGNHRFEFSGAGAGGEAYYKCTLYGTTEIRPA